MKAFLPGRIIREQAHALEVFDVSGAGDTVIAALAVMLGSGQSWDNTIAFANAAGGVAVGKLGTSIVLMDEVQQFLRGSA
jgi:bifunctional ADP-heptose synthase (sugar kinase/adenylyltransferase)